MKYYIAYSGESFCEAIHDRADQCFETYEQAVESAVLPQNQKKAYHYGKMYFFVVTDKMTTISLYEIIDGNAVLIRNTHSPVDMKNEKDKTDRDVLFELVNAMTNQTPPPILSPLGNHKFRQAKKKLGW